MDRPPAGDLTDLVPKDWVVTVWWHACPYNENLVREMVVARSVGRPERWPTCSAYTLYEATRIVEVRLRNHEWRGISLGSAWAPRSARSMFHSHQVIVRPPTEEELAWLALRTHRKE